MIQGRPMIAWVVDVARAARTVDDVAVITDHDEIARAAESAGARAVVSTAPADSGSDRIAQLLAVDRVAAEADIVVNLQGDEPLLEPAALDLAVETLRARADADVATLVRPRRADEPADDPSIVKVVIAEDGRALAFSRAPHPLTRVPGASDLVHIGLYAYRRAAFDRFVAAGPSALERAERLEQLRAFEIGLTIVCARFDSRAVAVDRPEDIARVEARLLGLDSAMPPT
jgi:3-deoxy-manno-octulosonate cytidylyltransferase (CMP-KDO synthetase)